MRKLIICPYYLNIIKTSNDIQVIWADYKFSYKVYLSIEEQETETLINDRTIIGQNLKLQTMNI